MNLLKALSVVLAPCLFLNLACSRTDNASSLNAGSERTSPTQDELCQIQNLDTFTCNLSKEIAKKVNSETITDVAMGYAKTAAMTYLNATFPGVGVILGMARKEKPQPPSFAELSEASLAKIQDIVRKEIDRGLVESQIYDAKTALNEADNSLKFVIVARENNQSVSLDSLLASSVRAVSPEIYNKSYVAAKFFQLAVGVRLAVLKEARFDANLRSEAAAAMYKLDRMHQDFVRSIQKNLANESSDSAYNYQAAAQYARFKEIFGDNYYEIMDTWALMAGLEAPKDGRLLAAQLTKDSFPNSLAATNPGLTDYYIRHQNFAAGMTTVTDDQARQDALFALVAGLGNPNCLSFRAVNQPRYYLRHKNFKVYLEKYDGTFEFDRDATFCIRDPRDGSPNVLISSQVPEAKRSFEALALPGYFLRHQNFELFISNDDSALGRADQTFMLK